ncbi:MAG TPA: VCBS repeat-containing protein [Pyrinomonadaceae bacterium]
MFGNKPSRNLFGILFLACLSIIFPIEIAAQCGGTYFKRVSTALVPVKGFYYESGDVTGDGVPDLVGRTADTPQSLGTKLFILPANGTGGFAAPIYIDAPAGLDLTNLRIGDFDNDNLKDIVGIFGSFPQSIKVYKNNGNGTFTPQTLFAVSGEIYYLIDINSDGKGDLITRSGNISFYSLGNGDGTFAAPVQFASNGVSAADFNSDGKVDFLAGTSVLLNQGGGIFSNGGGFSLGSSEFVVAAKDFTGDGKADVVTLTQGTTIKVSFLLNTGSGFQRTDYTIATDQQNANLYGTVFAGNFSGSSSPDFVYRVDDQNQTIVYTNDGAGNFSAQTFNYKLNGNVVGDFDNDGKTDVVRVSDSVNGGSPKLFGEVNATLQKNVCTRPGQTRIVDFDASGVTDFSYWTPANGTWATRGSPTVNWGAGSFGDIPAPGDFDGDGKTDHAIYRNSTGVWWILRSSDNQPSAVQFGLPSDKPVVGDYDGDSVSDLAVWRPSDGNWYVLFMGTQSYTIVHWGQDGDKPVPEDYDGDGKTDLAVFRPSNGTWYYLKSSDLNFVALQFGISTDRPVAADYDGDGKADIAVYRDSENILHVLRSYNLGYAAFQFGSAGDIPQPGDYDGDFVFDLGVYRPANQSWYSTNSLYQTPFGASNVIPTASILRIE